jgi:hypothetical protein
VGVKTPIRRVADTKEQQERRHELERLGEEAQARANECHYSGDIERGQEWAEKSLLYLSEWFTLLPLSELDTQVEFYADKLGITFTTTLRYERLALVLEELRERTGLDPIVPFD